MKTIFNSFSIHFSFSNNSNTGQCGTVGKKKLDPIHFHCMDTKNKNKFFFSKHLRFCFTEESRTGL